MRYFCHAKKNGAPVDEINASAKKMYPSNSLPKDHHPASRPIALKSIRVYFADGKSLYNVSIFTLFQYFGYHPTPPEVALLPMLFLELCNEGDRI